MVGFLRNILEAVRPDRGRTPAQLAQWLGLPEQELQHWLTGPPSGAYTYHRFTIPKKSGGERIIDAPSDDLKMMQRRVLQKLLNPLPVHAAAMGFVRRRSIVDNARPHAGRGVVINIDLADFFHSISAERVIAAWRGLGWNKQCARILANICTHEGRLPQGAPTSPALSNLICRKLDTRLAKLIQLNQSNLGHYTRYADDLTFSFPSFGVSKRRRRRPLGSKLIPRKPTTNRGIIRAIEKIIQGEGFRIQKKKRVRIQRAHQRQTATGLVVNAKVNLPREVRRKIRAMQHRQRLGQLTARQQKELGGWESLARMVQQQAGGNAA